MTRCLYKIEMCYHVANYYTFCHIVAKRYTPQQVSEEMNRNSRPMNTTVQLSTPTLTPSATTLQTDTQTDRRQYRAKSRSSVCSMIK